MGSLSGRGAEAERIERVMQNKGSWGSLADHPETPQDVIDRLRATVAELSQAIEASP